MRNYLLGIGMLTACVSAQSGGEWTTSESSSSSIPVWDTTGQATSTPASG